MNKPFDPTKPVRAVYVLTNTVNGKRYVGSTISLPERLRHHRHCSSGCRALRSAIKKHGWENFVVAVLDTVPADEALRLETATIARLGTIVPRGYNLSPTANGTAGYRWSDESRQRLSDAQKGKRLSAEHRRKIAARNVGRSWDDEHRAHFSKVKLGKKPSKATVEKMRATKKGVASWGSRIVIHGIEYRHMKDAAEALGVHNSTISWRAKQGWPGYEVIGRFVLGEQAHV